MQKKPSLSSSQCLATLESELQLAINKAKSEYEQSLINSFAQNNNSKIYRYISNLTGHSSIPSTIYLNSRSGSCDTDKAQLFNIYFHSVYCANASHSPSIFEMTSSSPSLTTLDFTVNEIMELLQ